MRAPTAQIVHQAGLAVIVQCPYCGANHRHAVDRLGKRERHAPGCGMFRSPAQRLAGYWFKTARPGQDAG